MNMKNKKKSVGYQNGNQNLQNSNQQKSLRYRLLKKFLTYVTNLNVLKLTML